VIIVACVISIGHWTDAISILSCTVCRYAAAVDTRTCSAPERCVLKCTCTLPGVRITAEREVHQSVDEGGSTVHVVLYAKNHATSAHVRQTEQADGVCLYRVQQRDVRSAIGLRSWRNRSRCVLSTDEVRPSHDGVSNTILLCGQMRILTPVERNLTLRSGVCVCVDDQLFGNSIFEGLSTGAAYPWFLQDELPGLLEDVPYDRRGRTYCQHGGVPRSSREIKF
jgi:hypothetical protein